MRDVWVAVCGAAMLVGGCATTTAPPAIAADLAVTGVSIVDTQTGRLSIPSDIVIAGGRIAAVVPAGSLDIPAATPRIDGRGRFAMPGLIDVHAHIGEGGIAPGSDSTRQRALRQFLRYGVTTIFVPGATGAGDADLPALRARCASREIVCPGLFATGSLITAPGSHPVSTIFDMPADTPPSVLEPRGVTVLPPEADVESLIAAKAAAGVDAVKIVIEDGPPAWYPKPRLTDEQVGAIVRAAHARDLPVFAHVSSARMVKVALDAGIDGIMHAPIDRLPDDLVRQMAERKLWYVPTFALYDGILTWARKQRESDAYAVKGVEPSAIASLANPGFLAASPSDEAEALRFVVNASDNLRRVAAAGVPIALGTDVNNPFVFPGFSAHEELALMVRAGMTPAQALATASIGGASFLRSADKLGRIAPGFEADIILLSRNPLDEIENSRAISAVLSDGRQVADVVSVD